jgi:hypothetical protein
MPREGGASSNRFAIERIIDVGVYWIVRLRGR